MPHEVQAKLKEWIRKREGEMSEDGAMKMAGEVNRALLLKDIPLRRIARIEISKRDNEREIQESESDADTALLKGNQDWERNRTSSFEVDREVNVVNYRRLGPQNEGGLHCKIKD